MQKALVSLLVLPVPDLRPTGGETLQITNLFFSCCDQLDVGIQIANWMFVLKPTMNELANKCYMLIKAWGIFSLWVIELQ